MLVHHHSNHQNYKYLLLISYWSDIWYLLIQNISNNILLSNMELKTSVVIYKSKNFKVIKKNITQYFFVTYLIVIV